MPTALLPHGRRLSWGQTIQFLTLVARVRWLDHRLRAAHRRVDRLGLDAAGPQLLRLAQRWLAIHEAISDLIGSPDPLHVNQVRAALRRPETGDCSEA